MRTALLYLMAYGPSVAIATFVGFLSSNLLLGIACYAVLALVIITHKRAAEELKRLTKKTGTTSPAPPN